MSTTIPYLEPCDPRPGGVPFYIENKCEDCGGPLVLSDVLHEAERRAEAAEWGAEYVVWNDDWECPVCQNGSYLDQHQSDWHELRQALKDPPAFTLNLDGTTTPLA